MIKKCHGEMSRASTKHHLGWRQPQADARPRWLASLMSAPAALAGWPVEPINWARLPRRDSSHFRLKTYKRVDSRSQPLGWTTTQPVARDAAQ